MRETPHQPWRTNINTKDYWDQRFASGHWDEHGGRTQTRLFAEAQVTLCGLPGDFSGTMVDFGCGLGDAIPVYRRYWPQATIVGVDLSRDGIGKCREVYGKVAEFIEGDHHAVPNADVIITSNVLEHLTNVDGVVGTLLRKCRTLIAVVPYRERITGLGEHVNSFDDSSFRQFDVRRCVVFGCAGWTEYGLRRLWWEVYAKNLLRPLVGKLPRRRAMQIMFEIAGTANESRV